ncbi:PDR/VanB family oxidoreductase [Actinomadura kijaniata]|uniref:Ferredoxin-NADP reductase n=1 Tax=Actinomadura namibiensis TaxID=182080 RepID=A0A7W3QJB2_ACTNM|nr:PDR/VanB family oxidoreductase [Actinomadura namibiensis]MBA8949304.1 ferredoxin-NADP reductase [Actinomadura namibiensis]
MTPAQIPPDLRGRRARDPFWVAASALFNGIQRVRALRTPVLPPVTPVDRTLTTVVREARQEAEDVVSLRLAAPDGRALPAWQPGCHLDVRLPSGRRRQYSLCGDPADRRTYRIAVRRLPHGAGGSLEAHTLAEGDLLTVSEPRNAFPFLPRDRYLFLAGGIGITPLLPMVQAARRLGADWRLVYTGRTRASLPFLDELPADRVEIRTDDDHGVPDCAELLTRAPAADAAIYCCGPAPMIDGVRAALAPHGPATLHFERFAPAPVVDGRPFEIELRRRGVTLRVPADRTALDVLTEYDPAIAHSCRQGFCGTCRVGLLAGDADRRHPGDTDPGSLLVCVSRTSGGRLVLDM